MELCDGGRLFGHRGFIDGPTVGNEAEEVIWAWSNPESKKNESRNRLLSVENLM